MWEEDRSLFQAKYPSTGKGKAVTAALIMLLFVVGGTPVGALSQSTEEPQIPLGNV